MDDTADILHQKWCMLLHHMRKGMCRRPHVCAWHQQQCGTANGRLIAVLVEPVYARYCQVLQFAADMCMHSFGGSTVTGRFLHINGINLLTSCIRSGACCSITCAWGVCRGPHVCACHQQGSGKCQCPGWLQVLADAEYQPRTCVAADMCIQPKRWPPCHQLSKHSSGKLLTSCIRSCACCGMSHAWSLPRVTCVRMSAARVWLCQCPGWLQSLQSLLTPRIGVGTLAADMCIRCWWRLSHQEGKQSKGSKPTSCFRSAHVGHHLVMGVLPGATCGRMSPARVWNCQNLG